jgi:co-chaperonin GroES (HSP10)
MNDLLLVERVEKPSPSKSGLYAGKPSTPHHLNLGIIITPPSSSTWTDSNALKKGDVVVIKNPWGIGPQDEISCDNKKLSYVHVKDVCAFVGNAN